MLPDFRNNNDQLTNSWTIFFGAVNERLAELFFEKKF